MKLVFTFLLHAALFQALCRALSEDDVCGFVTQEGRFATSGVSTESHWPWIASYGFLDKSGRWVHKCGATLINHRFLITAAHCAHLEELSDVRWHIRLGDTDLSTSADDVYMKEMIVEQKLIHPDYDFNTFYFDIAILRIPEVRFSTGVKPICLPRQWNGDVEYYQGFSAKTSGWGKRTETGSPSTLLTTADVQIFPYRQCNDSHLNARDSLVRAAVQDELPNLVLPHLLCAGYNDPRSYYGTCSGDSGGPLFTYNPESRQYTMIASMVGAVGETYAQKCGQPDIPQIYVRLDHPRIHSFIMTNAQLREENFQNSDRSPKAIETAARPAVPTNFIPTPDRTQSQFQSKPGDLKPVEDRFVPRQGGFCECEQLYLHATKILAAKQGAVLGIYTRGAEMHNGRSYYWKTTTTKTYYLIFDSNDWMVSDSLLANGFNIVTRRGDALCPAGILGGFDRNTTFDESFFIDCLDNKPIPNCCSTIMLNADEKIRSVQGARMGVYERVGEFNNHPMYYLSQFGYKNYLYFKMDGLERDGWTIGESPSDFSYAITTRQRSNCPNEVTFGYDRDLEIDTTFSITCME